MFYCYGYEIMLGLEMLLILRCIVVVLDTYGSHPAHLYTCSQRWTAAENVLIMMTLLTLILLQYPAQQRRVSVLPSDWSLM
jgi:hypothetical protein